MTFIDPDNNDSPNPRDRLSFVKRIRIVDNRETYGSIDCLSFRLAIRGCERELGDATGVASTAFRNYAVRGTMSITRFHEICDTLDMEPREFDFKPNLAMILQKLDTLNIVLKLCRGEEEVANALIELQSITEIQGLVGVA